MVIGKKGTTNGGLSGKGLHRPITGYLNKGAQDTWDIGQQESVLIKTQEEYTRGRTAFDNLQTEWNDLHIMISGIEIPLERFEFNKKSEALAKLKESAEKVEAANQERWDVYVEFLRTITKDMKISGGSTCIYIKEAAPAKSDLELDFSGPPELLSTPHIQAGHQNARKTRKTGVEIHAPRTRRMVHRLEDVVPHHL